jgi:hypothetical protein
MTTNSMEISIESRTSARSQLGNEKMLLHKVHDCEILELLPFGGAQALADFDQQTEGADLKSSTMGASINRSPLGWQTVWEPVSSNWTFIYPRMVLKPQNSQYCNLKSYCCA